MIKHSVNLLMNNDVSLGEFLFKFFASLTYAYHSLLKLFI